VLTQLPGVERSPLILRLATDALLAGRAGVYYFVACMNDAYRQLLATILTGALDGADFSGDVRPHCDVGAVSDGLCGFAAPRPLKRGAADARPSLDRAFSL
jgi:hypothetical protein